MKKITIEIPDDLYARLLSNVGIRKMSGNMYGVLDEFVLLLFASIEQGLESKVFRLRKPEEKKS